MAEAEKAKPKMVGTALEVDVIKKIAHQLSREGLTVQAMDRILTFTHSAVGEKKLELLRAMGHNGQLPISGTAQVTKSDGLF